MVEAYAVRWGHVSRGSTDGRLYRTRAGCLDEWLAERPAKIDVLIGHGLTFDTAEPSALLGESIGEFVDFRVDDVGLLTDARYSDSHLAGETLAAIKRGTIVAYSSHLRVFEVEDSGEMRGGEPVLDIMRAALVEAGPTHDPGDAGAVIVSVGTEQLRTASPAGAEPPADASLDDALAYLSSVSGLSVTLDDVADRHRRIDQAARQQVRDAEWLASQLGKARRAAEQAYRDSRAPWRRSDDLTRAHQLEREADELEADLRELLYNDPAAIADVLARCGVPPKVSPLARIKGLAR
jgi:phage head maturation protease